MSDTSSLFDLIEAAMAQKFSLHQGERLSGPIVAEALAAGLIAYMIATEEQGSDGLGEA